MVFFCLSCELAEPAESCNSKDLLLVRETDKTRPCWYLSREGLCGPSCFTWGLSGRVEVVVGKTRDLRLNI